MIGKEPVKVNDSFHAILDQIEHENQNLFITGRAGTGKSTLLSILKKTTRKRAVVVAPTGIAALNVGGQTIHSFFKFPPKMIDPSELTKRRNHRFYKKLQLLIIDEISMVRADMLDCIDIFLRLNLENQRPFGGVQVVFFGDLFQLPPVVASAFERQIIKEKYGSPYFFAAKVFEHCTYQMIELHQVFRQKERGFVRLLDNIRTRQFDYDDIEEINQRYLSTSDEGFAITLCSTNAKVDKINMEQLNQLDTAPYFYNGTIQGNFNPRLSPAPTELILKLYSQVMFVKNDPEGRFVNGTIGKVVDLEHDKITVQIYHKGELKLIDVEKVEWELTKYELAPENTDGFKSVVVGTYKQYPLRLAWAVTIHKSQGKTFEKVIIDLGRGAFDHGQTYVALSRCTSMDGITLKKEITPRDIMVDPVVVDYYENMKRR